MLVLIPRNRCTRNWSSRREQHCSLRLGWFAKLGWRLVLQESLEYRVEKLFRDDYHDAHLTVLKTDCITGSCGEDHVMWAKAVFNTALFVPCYNPYMAEFSKCLCWIGHIHTLYSIRCLEGRSGPPGAATWSKIAMLHKPVRFGVYTPLTAHLFNGRQQPPRFSWCSTPTRMTFWTLRWGVVGDAYRYYHVS